MWRIVLLIVAGYIVLAAHPEQAASKPTDRTDQQITAALENVATALKQEPDASRTERPCEKHGDDRASDLCAQWKAADAAKSAADAAWGLGIAGSLLGLLTLLVAVRAALYARDAATHTGTGVTVAQDTAHSQLRAYLDFDGVRFLREEAKDTDEETATGIMIRLRNYGATPATGITMETTYYVHSEHLEAHKVAFDADKQFSYIMPRDHAISNGRFMMSRLIWQAVEHHLATVRVEAKIRYLDYLKNVQTMECVFESYGVDEEFGFIAGTRHTT